MYLLSTCLHSDEAFVTSGQEMHLKTQYLESKVDQMMAEMTNVQKLMNIPEPDEIDNDTDDDEQYQEVPEDFESTSMQHVQEEKIDDAIKLAVHQLNSDVGHLKARVSTLEKLVTDPDHVRKDSKPGFLGELSSSTTAFVIVWPLAAFAILKFCTKWW